MVVGHSKKFQVQFRNQKYLVILHNYGKTKNYLKKKVNEEVQMTMVDFQQQSSQRLDDIYKHMNNQDNYLML